MTSDSNNFNFSLNRGLFITFEGIEGAGKSSVLKEIEKYLYAMQIDFIVTREFGGTEIAEKVRDVLLNHHYIEKMCPEAEVLLAFAGRKQHIEHLILPALQNKQWVLCDRFTDSTYAYQGAGRGLGMEKIAIIEDWVQGDLRPDFTLLFDLDAKIGLERVQKIRALDRIEVEKIEFFQRVREGYLEQARKEPNRYRLLDASRPFLEVVEQAKEIFKKL